MEPTSLPSLLQRLMAAFPDTVYVLRLSEGEPAWRTTVDVVAALATAVVGFLAILEMRRAGRAERALSAERESKELAIQSRMSAEAYALRHHLLSWLGRTPWIGEDLPTDKGLSDVRIWAQALRDIHPEIDSRMVRLMAAASEAKPEAATAFAKAYASYYFAVAAADSALRPHIFDLEVINRVLVGEHAIQTCSTGAWASGR
jgi:hypothetical protein